MPDEGRILVQLKGEQDRCECGKMPFLHRRTVGVKRREQGRTFKNGCRPEYQVRCRGNNPMNEGWSKECTACTPWLPSSQNAVQHWRVTKALSK